MKTFTDWQQERQLSEVDWKKIGHGSALAGSLLGGSLAGLGIANAISPKAQKTAQSAPANPIKTKAAVASKVNPVKKPITANNQNPPTIEVPAKEAPSKKTFVTDEPKASGSFKGYVDQLPKVQTDNCSFLSYIPVERYERFLKILNADGGKIEQEQKHGNIMMVWYKAPQKVQFECQTYLVWETEAHTGHIPGSGIQQHSAGPLFPIMIRGKGDALQAFRSNDQQGPLYRYDPKIPGSFHQAYDKAEADARIMLAAWKRGDEDITAGLNKCPSCGNQPPVGPAMNAAVQGF